MVKPPTPPVLLLDELLELELELVPDGLTIVVEPTGLVIACSSLIH
jgi:hypothetical protein